MTTWETLEALKKSRSSYLGRISTLRGQLDDIRVDDTEDLSRLESEEVSRLLNTATKTHNNFHHSLEAAQEFAPTESTEYDSFQEEEETAQDRCDQSFASLKRLANGLLAMIQVQDKLAELTDAITTIEDAISFKPDGDHTRAFDKLEIIYDSLKKEWNKTNLPKKHPVKGEIDECSKRITALGPEVSGAKHRAAPPPTLSTAPVIPRTERNLTKLPAIQLPTFMGDVLKWPTFWNQFVASVDSNHDLPDSTKLQYLRRQIKDPEAEVIMNPSMDGPDTYRRIVKELHLRYQRTKKIHRDLVNKLVQLPAAKHNSSDIRKLLDSATNCIECLQSTGSFNLEAVLSSIVYSKLPYKIQTDWDNDQPDDSKVLSYTKLFDYAAKKAFTLSDHTPATKPQPTSSKESTNSNSSNRKEPSAHGRNRTNVHVVSPAPAQPYQPKPCPFECKLCPGEKHFLYHCPKWPTFSIQQKLTHVATHKLCSNCLGPKHTTAECKSTRRCTDCHQKHHSSMHQTPAPPVTTISKQDTTSSLLTTAQVLLHGPNGETIQARVLIDSGSSISLLENRVFQQLNLPVETVKVQLTVALGASTKPVRRKTNLTITPLHDHSHKITCEPFISETVAGIIPQQQMPPATNLPHIKGLPLADAGYNIPGHIDLILGTDMFSQIMDKTDRARYGEKDEPVALPTVFGWTLGGHMPDCDTSTTSVYSLIPTVQTEPIPPTEPTLETLLNAILHEDEGPKEEAVQKQDDEVEKHYLDTVKYSVAEQRYEVTLPKKTIIRNLGESRLQAVTRFMQTSRAAYKKGTHESLKTGIKSYIELGHAELVPLDEKPPALSFWLPMHAVIKLSSTTTKTRVVFDGSAITTSGISLNQALHVGPTIQATLSDTLLKFRTYPVALNADISKMYREIKLCSADKDLHRFVWRDDPAMPLLDYRMTRVTFGVSASPFLAIRTLHQAAVDHGEGYPEATQHILTNFYVDDYLGGASSPEEAITLFHQLRDILRKGGFDLRKWRSSSTKVTDHIPNDLLETDPIKTSTAVHSTTHSKALGLHWDSSRDVMSPAISTAPLTSSTKRGLVSAIFRTYDVLGWMSPTTLLMKILIQGLWKAGKGWDDPAPETSVKAYQEWREELKFLAEKTLPRRYHQDHPTSITLHGFGDASQAAYGAVIYCRATYSNRPPTTSLVTSKTKLVKQPSKPTTSKDKKPVADQTSEVKPVKKTNTTTKSEEEPIVETIPKLELCASLLLAKLLSKVGDVLKIDSSDWYAYSDSTTVLAWLIKMPTTQPVYVTNRLRQTLEITKPSQWSYVPTACNPADCASRGISPTALSKLTLWWEGPPWLKSDPVDQPAHPDRKPSTEAGPTVNILIPYHSVAENLFDLPQQYPHIVATTAWCRRFIDRIQHGRPQPDLRTRQLKGEERRDAERWLLREAQRRAFPQDLKRLQAGKKLARDSRLKSLTPKLDQHQLLRVEGRLENSARPNSSRHPIICDAQDAMMKKYFEYIHLIMCHCGPSSLLANTGSKLHVIGARRLSRQICSRCTICRTCRPITSPQFMAELPSPRVNASPPFTHCGMDYAGPFHIKMGYIRKPTILDAFVCVFVCLSTKAVHLEVVSDQATDSFKAALQRFIARRGCPQHFYSDNGGNFVGARNNCRKLYAILKSQVEDEDIQHFLATHHEIQWHNNPAYSPHMGGLWEAAVKGMKAHLKRVMGVINFTFEELTTIICRIEACMNSRPLIPITSHCPDGSTILTSGHFLTNKGTTSYPEDPRPLTNLQRLHKWQLCEGVVQQFWTRWSKEYLNSLQARTKWQYTTPNLQIDDVVAIKPIGKFLPCHWPLGRVHRLLPGNDDRVRVVELQTKTGFTQRAVARLALIYRPGEDEEPPPGNLSRQDEQDLPAPD